MSKRLCTSLLISPSQSRILCQPCLRASSNTIISRHEIPYPRNRRSFANTARHSIGAQRQITNRQKAQPSMSLAMKNQQAAAQKDGSILDHLGIVEGTFVPPTGANLPSYLSNWRDRLKIQKLYLKNFFYTYIHSRVTSWYFIKPRLSLELAKTPTLAKDLYQEMYTHFARGDLSAVESKLSPGLMGSLRARIAQRPANTSLLWKLHAFIGRPELVSYRVALLPKQAKSEQMGVTQAVVRIRSQQSLAKVQKKRVRNAHTGMTEIQEVVVDAVGNEVPNERVDDMLRQTAKYKTEYLVIQRYVKKSRPGPWHVWGETGESTLEKIKRAEAKTAAALTRSAT